MKKTISVSMARRDGGLNQALQRLAKRRLCRYRGRLHGRYAKRRRPEQPPFGLCA